MAKKNLDSSKATTKDMNSGVATGSNHWNLGTEGLTSHKQEE